MEDLSEDDVVVVCSHIRDLARWRDATQLSWSAARSIVAFFLRFDAHLDEEMSPISAAQLAHEDVKRQLS